MDPKETDEMRAISRLVLCVMGPVILPHTDNHTHTLCTSAYGYGQKSWDMN